MNADSFQNRAELADDIARVALLRGTFTLRSGKTSNYYLDKYLFTTQPRILARLADLFETRIRALVAELGARVDRLAGAELGGIPLVTAVSMKMNIPALLVRNQRKDYGTSKLIEGAFTPGESTVLLEDVATTGGQAIEAIKCLRDAGLHPIAVISTIDRLEGAREAIEAEALFYEHLFTRKDLGVND